MHTEFESIHNHHEQAVFAAVETLVAQRPELADAGLQADIACVALNRLPPRYIRHHVDFVFYRTEAERLEIEAAIQEAVVSAIGFIERKFLASRAR